MKKELKQPVKLSYDLYKKIVQLSALEGRTITYLIDRAVSNYLKIKIDNRLTQPKN
jgi:hypothetical protein